jgi:hypothetical protein
MVDLNILLHLVRKLDFIFVVFIYSFLHFGLFQDCAVGLLFALLPVLGGNSGLLQGVISMGKL